MGTPWQILTLGEICTLKYGKMPRREDLVAEGYPVFSGYRVIGYHKRYLYEQPEVVVVARGAGGCGEVRLSPPRAYITNLAIVLQPASPHVDKRFLFYRLAHTTLRELRTGAAQPQIVISDLRKYRVTLPPLPTQRAIADLLATYDDLLANNTRRIAILESIARELYREWFGRMRFPGHEQVELVDSPLGKLPRGWQVQPFTVIANFVNGYPFTSRHWGSTGKPIVKIAELKSGVTERTAFYHGRDIPSQYHIRDGDVLFSWSADLDVYIWTGGDGLLNQHLFNVFPRAGYTAAFVYHSLKHRIDEFRNRSHGTTMRHIKRSVLDQVCLAIPTPEQRAAFETHAGPIIQAILGLSAKNALLRRTRDLLMDRLLTGEVDITAPEIDDLEQADL